jgi:hypothetical protein
VGLGLPASYRSYMPCAGNKVQSTALCSQCQCRNVVCDNTCRWLECYWMLLCEVRDARCVAESREYSRGAGQQGRRGRAPLSLSVLSPV